jgi:hypothetical protein
MAATVVIAVAFAVPLRGLANVQPEIERVIEFEGRTAGAYDAAVIRFQKGRITAKALAELIDRTIRPELQANRARLKALGRVPSQHQPLIAGTEEYLRLRDEGWRLRADGLRKGSMVTLREAEKSERASLEALENVKATR